MTALPTVEQFQSFHAIAELLNKEAHQCIWYLPNRRRLCRVPITVEDQQEAFRLGNSLWKPGLTLTKALTILKEFAQKTCCGLHHRNKIYGSGLAQKLAHRWFHEINPSQVDKIKCEEAILPDVEFVRHEVYVKESLHSHLLSDIGLDAPRAGIIYFYTHAEIVFRGMIKIGYTSRSLDRRLQEWGDCGYGHPQLLGSCEDVRYPERVELLTHFELVNNWHEMRWCKPCGKSHREWFKVEVVRALEIASLWNRWMHDANPYDRRGCLKDPWKAHIDFLIEHGNPITAEAMFLIHKIEVGEVPVDEFIDDEMLRIKAEVIVKEEEGGSTLLSVPEGR